MTDEAATASDAERQELVDAIQGQFNVELLHCEHASKHRIRPDAAVYVFAESRSLCDDVREQIRLFAAARGWHFIRRRPVSETCISDFDVTYLAKMNQVELRIGYHATRRANLESITSLGLLPSRAERQNNRRDDCTGNIYLCRKLGSQLDEGAKGAESAFWWRHHLANHNRFNDQDWIILEVDTTSVPDAMICSDFCSNSGVIVSGVSSIPSSSVRIIAD